MVCEIEGDGRDCCGAISLEGAGECSVDVARARLCHRRSCAPAEGVEGVKLTEPAVILRPLLADTDDASLRPAELGGQAAVSRHVEERAPVRAEAAHVQLTAGRHEGVAGARADISDRAVVQELRIDRLHVHHRGSEEVRLLGGGLEELRLVRAHRPDLAVDHDSNNGNPLETGAGAVS